MKVLVVMGTRPEAIKMAPVVYALRDAFGFEGRVCLTAQHRDMLDEVIRVFDLPVHDDLDLMAPGQTLTHVAVKVLEGVDRILAREHFDWVLVQGDTTTSLAAAQAAFHREVKVGHVEAGLRTWNIREPFPEEWNRRAIDALADLAFAPTELSRQNLLGEKFAPERVLVTGNTAIDALHIALARPAPPPPPELEALSPERPMILVTAHRRESFGAPLDSICRALAELAARPNATGASIVYPVHPNPNVLAAVARHLEGKPNVHLLKPLDYHRFVHLMQRAHLILSDSGGIQEEAPGLGKPVLVLRDRTERPEAVTAGTARLVGTDTDHILAEVDRLLTDQDAYRAMAVARNPFGDGHAAERIVRALAGELATEAP
ncbi:MAG: UDP-N-acetylglucosamine 2-epimerase (non-hydrolyzing) [Candidatus Eisenbacteria bacterium]